MKSQSIATLCIAALAAAAFPAIAGARDDATRDKLLVAELLPQPHSPILITFCAGAARAGNTPEGANVVRSLVTQGVRIRNTGVKTISAVRFRFDYVNDFNEVETNATDLRTIEGTYSHGVDVNLGGMNRGKDMNLLGRFFDFGTFEGPTNASEAIDKMICSVDSVKYADGSVWHASFARDLSAAQGHYAVCAPPNPDGYTPFYQPRPPAHKESCQ